MDEMNTNVSVEDTNATAPVENNNEPSASEQELKIKIAMLEKKANKAASDAAEWKKKYNSTLDEREKLELAKSEEDAAFKEKYAEMERRLELSDNKNKFSEASIPSEYIEDLSVAFYEQDKATFFNVLAKAIDSVKKSEKAGALKNMPTAPISSDSSVSMTKEQYDNLSYLEQIDFKTKNPELWEKFI